MDCLSSRSVDFADQPCGPGVWRQLGRKTRLRCQRMRMGLTQDWGQTASARSSPCWVCARRRIRRLPIASWAGIWERRPRISSFRRRIIMAGAKKPTGSRRDAVKMGMRTAVAGDSTPPCAKRIPAFAASSAVAAAAQGSRRTRAGTGEFPDLRARHRRNSTRIDSQSRHDSANSHGRIRS